jgi:hypothetical protein
MNILLEGHDTPVYLKTLRKRIFSRNFPLDLMTQEKTMNSSYKMYEIQKPLLNWLYNLSVNTLPQLYREKTSHFLYLLCVVGKGTGG